MPTGYTAGVQDGEITEFRDFAMLCARAMGATIMIRDEPFDTPIPEFVPDNYHANRIKELESELVGYGALSADDWERKATEHRETQEAEYRRSCEKNAAERGRYEAMLEKVRGWCPPSKDHEGMKEFMIEQLESSIRFDCHEPRLPDRVTTEEYKRLAIETASESLAYNRREHKEEIERTRERNEWVRLLRESLT